jgi:hypothetical protein
LAVTPVSSHQSLPTALGVNVALKEVEEVEEEVAVVDADVVLAVVVDVGVEVTLVVVVVVAVIQWNTGEADVEPAVSLAVKTTREPVGTLKLAAHVPQDVLARA